MYGWNEFDPNPKLEIAFRTQQPERLQAYLGPSSKRVVINENLPDGVLFSTANEIILSSKGWERLALSLEARSSVREIVERELADVLAWLREAGHDV